MVFEFDFICLTRRLLHETELRTHLKTNVNDCIQEQSYEMNELCHYLINQQRTNPTDIFNKLIDDFRIALIGLKTSFESKINYLSDIHSSTIDKLNAKHEIEINEIKCELSLISNQQQK